MRYSRHMKIVDFDPNRRRGLRQAWLKRLSVPKMLGAAGAVLAVVSTVVWLARDVKDVVGDLGPTEGSVIVNINTATEAELITIPGIGPTRAAQIIALRPYSTVDELERIAGISGKTLESLRPFVTVEGETRKITKQ